MKYYITSSQGASSKKLNNCSEITSVYSSMNSTIRQSDPEQYSWKQPALEIMHGHVLLGPGNMSCDIQQSAWHSYHWCLRTICNNLSTINYYSGSHLHKIVNGLQVIQVVIMHIHTETEVQSSITTIHNLEIAKLKPENTYCS